MNCPFPSLCAYSAWYISSWWKRPRPHMGLPCWRLIYRRCFALLAALFTFRYVVPSVRFAMRLVIASRPAFLLFVSFCVPLVISSLRLVRACRLAYRSACRFSACPVGRWFLFGTVSSCSPLTICHVVSCRAVPCRLVLRAVLRSAFPSRHCALFSLIARGLFSRSAPFRLARRSQYNAIPYHAMPCRKTRRRNGMKDEARTGRDRTRRRDEKRNETRDETRKWDERMRAPF